MPKFTQNHLHGSLNRVFASLEPVPSSLLALGGSSLIVFLCPSLVLLGLKPKNSPRGLQLPRDVAPGLWESCWEQARQGLAPAWVDKELLENARDLESLLLASCREVTGKGSHNCGENPLCVKAAYPGGLPGEPGDCSRRRWPWSHHHPPGGGKKVNLGKELVKEPGGWCHFGTKGVWVNIPGFGSREGMSSCPSVV